MTEKKQQSSMKDLDVEVRQMLGGGQTDTAEAENPVKRDDEEEKDRGDKEDEK